MVDNAPANPRTAMAAIALIHKLLGDDNQHDEQASADARREYEDHWGAIRKILAENLKDYKKDAHLASVVELVAFCFSVRDASGAMVPFHPQIAGMAERMKTYEPYFKKGTGECTSSADADRGNAKADDDEND
jgi:hypothetical protein